MPRREDKELEQYRRLMEPPDTFEDGFNWKTVVAAVFLGFIMMPGTMYLQLVVGLGGGMSQAARWMTIILFAEVARRSLKDLRQQEVYILYFMAGLTMGAANQAQGLLWNQFLARSEFAQAMGIAQDIPTWVAPSAAQMAKDGRSFFTMSWVPAILFTSFALLISKIDHYGLGYVLWRLTSDVEKLPFPMAPVAASGITALANTREQKQRWRWRCFAIGGVMGLTFGAVYIAVPAVTGAILAKPIQLIPIPWVDLTPALTKFIKAAPLNISFNLSLIFVGMVLPFWAVIGGVIGVLITMLANPILYHYGILSSWQPQMGVIDTIFSNKVDFYLSFEVGLTVAIALVSLGRIFTAFMDAVRERRTGETAPGSRGVRSLGGAMADRVREGWRKLVTNNVERGDFSIFVALGIYVCTSALWIGLATYLIEGFPWPFFVFYAAIYTPVLSYATAKLEGLCGQALTIPMVREATYILSGYRGVRIWFAPAPLHNYGIATVEFRIMELTGTKIRSQILAQIVALPIIVISMVVFSQLMWHMADVPSDAYPFAQKMWELRAKNLCLTYSATMEGGSMFMEAWKWRYFGWGLGLGTAAYVCLSSFGLPTLLVFGIVRGLGQGTPAHVTFELVGALVGRFYFRKRFGSMWMKYTPVLLAGFSCGMGLIGMVAVAFTILTKMMAPLVY